MQSLWLIIVVFFLIVLILPIFSKAYVTFDFLNNIGVISLYIFCFKIITYKAKFQKFKLVIFTSKDEKDIEVQVSQKQMRFLKQMSVQLKEKLILKDILLDYMSCYNPMGIRRHCGLKNTKYSTI